MYQTQAIANWRLLESEIVSALRQCGLKVEKNSIGDPVIGEVNFAALARALSKRVLVKATPVGAKT
jgi:hypothetical protein